MTRPLNMLSLVTVLVITGVVQAAPLTCQGPGDVIFALDGSDSIKRDNFKRMITFVQTNINSFEIGSNKIRVGALVYSSNVTQHFDISDDKTVIDSKITDLRRPGHGTRTDLAIDHLHKQLLKSNRTRVGVIITDGDSHNTTFTTLEAEEARNDGITLVGVGIEIDKAGVIELEKITGNKALVKTIDSFSKLESLTTIEEIRKLLCGVITTTTTTTTPRPMPISSITIDPLCEGCVIDNGFGYNSYKDDCSKFVMCFKSVDSKGKSIMRAEVKQCAYGTYWSQDDLTCVGHKTAECPTSSSICASLKDDTTLPYLGCRTYWICKNKQPIPSCCPSGQHYDNTKSKCVSGTPVGCSNVNCGGSRWGSSGKRPCTFEKNSKDSSAYFEKVTAADGTTKKVSRSCPGGTIYDDRQCGCILDVSAIGKAATSCKAMIKLDKNGKMLSNGGNLWYGRSSVDFKSDPEAIRFTSNSHINIWRLANHEFMDTFGITFTLKTTPFAGKTGSETEQILTNCLQSESVKQSSDCTSSVSIQVRKEPKNKFTFIGELKTTTLEGYGKNQSKALQTTVTSDGKALDVTMAYDGSNFALKINGDERSTSLTGWIQRRQSGFVFGRPMALNKGIQYLDASLKWINIYDCIPEEIKDNLSIM